MVPFDDFGALLGAINTEIDLAGLQKREPFIAKIIQLFETMLDSLREAVTQQLSRVRPLSEDEQREMMMQMAARQSAAQQAAAPAEEPLAEEPRAGFVESDPSTWGNPSRNDKCPCGSGKKFKHCHGKLG